MTDPGTVGRPRLVTLTVAHLGRAMEIEQCSFSNPWCEADFIAVLADARTMRLGLIVADELVGFAIGYPGRAELHLANLAIDPPLRRQGWGGYLLCRTLEQARLLGCRWCSLEVRESNLAAIRMYLGHGFEQIGRRRWYYSRPEEDAVVMRCTIEKH